MCHLQKMVIAYKCPRNRLTANHCSLHKSNQLPRAGPTAILACLCCGKRNKTGCDTCKWEVEAILDIAADEMGELMAHVRWTSQETSWEMVTTLIEDDVTLVYEWFELNKVNVL